MLRIILSGCNGHMGQSVAALCENSGEIRIVAGVSRSAEKKNRFPVYSDPTKLVGIVDAVIDFSHPANLTGLIGYATDWEVPLVLCTTGYSEAQEAEILEAAKLVPIFKSGNMSLGVNLMIKLAREAASALGGEFDVEIVEKHHRRKVDAPSGTALMLADAVSRSLPYEPEYVYERQSERKPRGEHEIGISSVRGGTIAGEHEIIFAGTNEVLEIRHSAQSREVFASGALAAAKYISKVRTPGLYGMDDLLSGGGA